MKSEKLFTGKSLSFGSAVKQMTFLDGTSFKPKVPTSVSVTFDLLVSSSSLSGNSIQCAFLKYADDKEIISTATVSSEGCTYDKTFSVGNQTFVRCICNHLTDFFVGLSPSVNPAATSPTPSASPSPGATTTPGSSSTSNAGLIAGVVVGVLAVAAAVAGAIIVRRRKSQQAAMYAPSTIEQGQVSSPAAVVTEAASPKKSKKRSDDDDGDDNAPGPSANARPKEESLPTYSESPTRGYQNGERKKKKKKKRTTD